MYARHCIYIREAHMRQVQEEKNQERYALSATTLLYIYMSSLPPLYSIYTCIPLYIHMYIYCHHSIYIHITLYTHVYIPLYTDITLYTHVYILPPLYIHMYIRIYKRHDSCILDTVYA